MTEPVLPPVAMPNCMPERWWVCFHREAFGDWRDRLIPGRYKHVSMFGYVPACSGWVFVDPAVSGTRVRVVPDGKPAIQVMTAVMAKADSLLIAPRLPRWVAPYWLGGWCTRTVARLLGLGACALWPSQLWRSCRPWAEEVIPCEDAELHRERRDQGAEGARHCGEDARDR